MENIDVLIVDDHELFRSGLELILRGFEFVNEVHIVSNGLEYLELIKTTKPDVVLMDINMPEMDGITATELSKKLFPEIKILAISMQGTYREYERLNSANVDGFILKDTSCTELENAITTVYYGGNYFSREVLQNALIGSKSSRSEVSIPNEFSQREIEIIQLISRGLSNIEISKKIFLSKRTVEKHRFNILRKSKSKNSISLVTYALKNNIIDY